MKQRSTLDDVARRCGVSGKTVSRVVNGEPYVSARVREAVENAIAELNYRPNIAAKALASSRTSVIGVLSPHIESSYFRRLHAFILGACRQNGCHMVIEQIALDGTHLDQVRRFVERMEMDGLLLTPGLADSGAVLKLIKDKGIRAVAISPRSARSADLIVQADEDQGEMDLADVLWQAGHRRYAIAKPPASWSFARGKAFRKQLLELGALPEEIIDFDIDGTVPGLEGGRRLAIAILAHADRPTALFAASDELAAGAIGLCLTRGLSVPDDIAIAGFDDDDIAQAVWPSLTTIKLPLEAMIDRAVALLVGSQRMAATATLTLPATLIQRGSTSLSNRLQI